MVVNDHLASPLQSRKWAVYEGGQCRQVIQPDYYVTPAAQPMELEL